MRALRAFAKLLPSVSPLSSGPAGSPARRINMFFRPLRGLKRHEMARNQFYDSCFVSTNGLLLFFQPPANGEAPNGGALNSISLVSVVLFSGGSNTSACRLLSLGTHVDARWSRVIAGLPGAELP